jgi:hypothetical protein
MDSVSLEPIWEQREVGLMKCRIDIESGVLGLLIALAAVSCSLYLVREFERAFAQPHA